MCVQSIKSWITSLLQSRLVTVKRVGGRGFGLSLSGNAPVVVRSVDPRGPADMAGIRPGDTIFAVNGLNVRYYSAPVVRESFVTMPISQKCHPLACGSTTEREWNLSLHPGLLPPPRGTMGGWSQSESGRGSTSGWGRGGGAPAEDEGIAGASRERGSQQRTRQLCPTKVRLFTLYSNLKYTD